jgi:hypothetical protein
MAWLMDNAWSLREDLPVSGNLDARTKPVCVLSFAFWRQGGELERSTLSMYRNLVYHILVSDNGQLELFTEEVQFSERSRLHGPPGTT